MQRSIILLLVSLGVVSVVLAEPPAPIGAPPVDIMPQGAALPQIMIVEKTTPDSGWVTLVKEQTVYKNVPFVIQEEVVVNGMKMLVQKTGFKMVPVIEKVQQEWLVGEGTASDVAGNKLTRDEAFKRLQPGTAVLILPPGQKLSPAYQRLFNKDAVILISGGKMPG